MFQTDLVIGAALGLLVITQPASPSAARAAEQTGHSGVHAAALQIPHSLQAEHEEIHAMLEAATRAPGRVGVAAKELAAVLGPHFERENQIALPPLGLLAPLAAGQTPAGLEDTLVMSETLRAEMPRMLAEHEKIRAATEKLRTIARADKASTHEHFAERLAAHARMEEEVLYPAAILVGDVIRARLTKR